MIKKDIENKIVIIAEAGVNHNGSVERALEMVDVAAEAGADIIKFQTFNAKQVITQKTPKVDFQLRNTGKLESMLEMAQKLELNNDAHHLIMQQCKERGIEFLSSPFDLQSMRYLIDKLILSKVKIASGEITNFPLLLAAGQSKRKIILSSGMSSLGEIEAALGVIAYGLINSDLPCRNSDIFRDVFSSLEGQNALHKYVSLLHCTTEYPSNFEDVNLRAMDTMREAFGLQVGLSDHTLGITVPIAAAARGATIIEKHFTLDKNLEGPDHIASLDPSELSIMVRSIREVELSLGNKIKYPTASEKKNLPIVRRSLTAACEISQGEKFTAENLTTKRPGTGIPATKYWEFIGTKACRNYQEDEQIENFI